MKIKDTKTALAAAPWNMGVEELAVQNPLMFATPIASK